MFCCLILICYRLLHLLLHQAWKCHRFLLFLCHHYLLVFLLLILMDHLYLLICWLILLQGLLYRPILAYLKMISFFLFSYPFSQELCLRNRKQWQRNHRSYVFYKRVDWDPLATLPPRIVTSQVNRIHRSSSLQLSILYWLLFQHQREVIRILSIEHWS